MKGVEGREGSEEEKTGKVKEEKGTLGLTLTLKKSKKEPLRSVAVTAEGQKQVSYSPLTTLAAHSLTRTHISHFPKLDDADSHINIGGYNVKPHTHPSNLCLELTVKEMRHIALEWSCSGL